MNIKKTSATGSIKIADRAADATIDAYSFENYGRKEWGHCALHLIYSGYQKHEAETILKSKIMRWAADGAAEPWRADHTDLIAFMAKWPDQIERATGIKTPA